MRLGNQIGTDVVRHNSMDADLMLSQSLRDRLGDFFRQWRSLSAETPLETRLTDFFGKLSPLLSLRAPSTQGAAARPGAGLELDALEDFLVSLRQPLDATKKAGFLCDPWEIASLRRDEVRNARVLAWLLNPRGSHGFGDRVLARLLHNLEAQLPGGFPCGPSERCRVLVESCPDGDRDNRVDIEIDDPTFLLIIEVKIDAAEGPDQLNRYTRVAFAKALHRPWCVLFLTRGGKPSVSVLERPQHVLPVSWKAVASAMDHALSEVRANRPEQHYPPALVTHLLASRFMRHIRKL